MSYRAMTPRMALDVETRLLDQILTAAATPSGGGGDYDDAE